MLIKVRVTVGARAEKVVKKTDDLYVVSVKEKAEQNEANKRVLEIFRKLYPRKSVRIVKGHHSPSKIVEVG
ncbi:MAG: hypothetical protein A3C79_00865 [Candidatus Taylorbacteria bacterium RIFCSPHIGHO2_02_FULL_45_28]|uniref:YggU family protein n=1 Tax=Candidatus Taylorbacteria bacterium RIFCSPHIGHO2_12_FULL_45_16 TaxID=1802315 RepID=A0A1G2MZI4_9BACT|nr:MAG: hypothetical protein A2830_02115 [Candidatus Taylorbacteria bacterium RIFCSPHIGHO2_01_FULL_44_110]OHA25571.1 MAG: hypothetical protein A3C79_00865 [Candidatus Taylorbacteria bacterium RIFCSPHIGHO2_02_FULL_45_28]OHA29238.1 MAG: hypothetical protein A3F51_01330 [Candidatus Taylorbacteria bacterium RIFCSPHIGHO2_12_FULL_45_16]OHA33460.1 MAG: hypothetical protein A3A23_02210 [Candidatus Taylorbacteria bacterium RIFCSPLOWO2_01_FULL_45_59]OHA39211.1 MAG: hypothetical protein A3I98_02080 [Candi